MELPIHQIIGGDNTAQPFHPRRPGKPVDPRQTHQNSDETFADLDPHPESQFGMNPAGPVGAAGGNVDLADQAGEPLPAHLCR